MKVELNCSTFLLFSETCYNVIMVFDDSLSETVSLSKVLDQLIADEESPDNVVMPFLQQHEDDFKDIISDSLNWIRIFQLDFFFNCNASSQHWILNKLKSIPAEIAAYLCWQICKTESAVADKIKYEFKKEFSWILKMFDTKHPYSSMSGKIISEYDYRLFSACKDNTFAEEIDSWSLNAFKQFNALVQNSLFRCRFYQYDVFSKLGPAKQYLILNRLQNISFWTSTSQEFYQHTICFLKQILSSDEISELKFEAMKSYVNVYKNISCINMSYNDIEQTDVVDECDNSYAKLKLKMLLNGVIDNSQIILELFLKHKKDILISWLKDDSKSLNESIRVSQLVQYMKDKKLFNKY